MRAFSLTLIICGVLLLLPRPWTERILVENGPIEMPTAIAYFVAAVMLWLASERRWHCEVPAALLLVACGLRELDFQARFTTGYAFSSRYFLRETAPLPEKTIVVAILFFLAVLVVVLLIANWRHFAQGFRAGDPWASSVALAVGFMIASTTLDEVAGLLRREYPGTDTALFVVWVFEETLEAMIPILFATAIVQSATTTLPAVERPRRAA